jgi:hypothetical protein
MNFKLNLLAAAALMAAASPSFAAMQDATTGNGELLVNLRFYTGDNNSGGDDISAVFDLGITMNDFIANPGLMSTIDLTSANYGTAWNDVMAFAGANKGLIEYNVIALDNSNNNTAGGSRYLTTANVTTFPALPNQNLNNFAFMNGYVTINNGRGTHTTEANGASTALSSDVQNSYFGKVNGGSTDGDTWSVQTTADTTRTLGTAQSFWFLTTSSVTTTAQANKSAFGLDLNGDGKISLATEFDKFLVGADGKVSYVAAVPEASTYGMMLAGLGLVGFVARRRLQA